MVFVVWCIFLFKQETACESCISDWSSCVCSSDLMRVEGQPEQRRIAGIKREIDGPGYQEQFGIRVRHDMIRKDRNEQRLGSVIGDRLQRCRERDGEDDGRQDRKRTSLNSSH